MKNRFWATMEYNFGKIPCKDITGEGITETQAIKEACMLFLKQQQKYPSMEMRIKRIKVNFNLPKEYRRSLGLE